MIDPVAAFDQLGAVFRHHAEMTAQYYKQLRDNGVPPTLARELTREMQAQTLKILGQNRGTT